MEATEHLATDVGTAPACRAMGVPRSSVYAQRRGRYKPKPAPRPRPTPQRALDDGERQAVLDELHSERFVDKAPAEVYATLLDEEKYFCSERTMYRILAAHDEVRERRNQLRHPNHPKPELVATGPNQVWSWDITKLKGPAKWVYYYLYVVLDIFSRYVVGWTVGRRETAALAKRLVEETCEKEGIEKNQLDLHADRGSPMISKTMAQLLADLGVNKSHSRPHVSNDNPYSESQFKTLKYRPQFPDHFGSLEDALECCRHLFRWYNLEHRHSGIGLMTPYDVHYGRADLITKSRQKVLTAAFCEHPERFVHGAPRPPALPKEVWINRPTIIVGP
jgi:putative transposase